MKKIEHILTDEEKVILENKFIYNKYTSRINFEEFTSNLISKYTENPFNISRQPRVPEHSINLIWDKELSQTAMMHFFSNKSFSLSNSKMKGFRIFNGDINVLDIYEENAIMKLARNRSQINLIKMFLRNNEDGFNFKQISKNKESIHSVALETVIRDVTSENRNFLQNDLGILDFINKVDLVEMVVKNWVIDLKGTNPDLDNKIFNLSENTIIVIRNALKDREEKHNKKYNFSMLFESLNNTEKFLLSYKLQGELKINLIVNKKIKI